MEIGKLHISLLDNDYEPDQAELDEIAEVERLQRECKSSHDNLGEDGCLDCGYGAP